MSKPIVRYADCMPICLGQRVWVMALDHPKHPPRRWLLTSPVTMLDTRGRRRVFETRNSRYEGQDWEAADPCNTSRMLA